ncbi:transcriptional regulator [Agaricicola taiwanensis]|uniref:Transcriptional regulator n=1 Tax=Agaricicola taiwanensis TaxID=591372 RepID=A0A8J2YM70_9RHOB|nr:IclR family transcriptional regulator [Agaricicola taiwanensis]GGE51611.1 transcriptional regulator [Agaricicola taiwanensis]
MNTEHEITARRQDNKPDRSEQSAQRENDAERVVGKPVGAIIAGVAVLRALHRAQRPLRASEVAREAELHRGTAFNILRTLQRESIITYNERDRTYSIGIMVLELAHGVLRTSGLLDVVRPEMFSLAERLDVTVALGKVEQSYDLVLLDFVGGGFRVDSYFSVGRRSRRFSGASGLVMAAFSGAPPELIEAEYEHTEWFRRPPFEEYVERMEATRTRGFALDLGNRRSGLTQVAVPIFSQTGSLALVLTVADFSYTMNDERIADVAKAMLAFSDRMSSELGRLRLD